MDYSLSNEDINKVLEPHPTNIITYPMLHDVDDIDEIFDDKGRCIMLYPLESKYSGHWVAIMRHPNNIIEYFDSYSSKPDTEKNWISEKKQDALNIQADKLTELLKKEYRGGAKIIYNPYKLQRDKDNINTCGRHACSRLAFKDLTLKQYRDMIKLTGLTPDQFVTRLTYEILNK